MTQQTLLKNLKVAYKDMLASNKKIRQQILRYDILMSELEYSQGKGRTIGNISEYIASLKNKNANNNN